MSTVVEWPNTHDTNPMIDCDIRCQLDCWEALENMAKVAADMH